MEEVLVVFFQLFFEVGVQFFGGSGLDLSLGEKGNKGCLIFFLHAILGGGLGWISTLLVPKLFLTIAALRMLNLIVAPLLAGDISWLVAKKYSKQDASAAFMHAALFALMYSLARFAFGER